MNETISRQFKAINKAIPPIVFATLNRTHRDTTNRLGREVRFEASLKPRGPIRFDPEKADGLRLSKGVQ